MGTRQLHLQGPLLFQRRAVALLDPTKIGLQRLDAAHGDRLAFDHGAAMRTLVRRDPVFVIFQLLAQLFRLLGQKFGCAGGLLDALFRAALHKQAHHLIDHLKGFFRLGVLERQVENDVGIRALPGVLVVRAQLQAKAGAHQANHFGISQGGLLR